MPTCSAWSTPPGAPDRPARGDDARIRRLCGDGSGLQGGLDGDLEVAANGVGDRAALLGLLGRLLEPGLVVPGDHAVDLKGRPGDNDATTLLGVEGDGRGDVQSLGRIASLSQEVR